MIDLGPAVCRDADPSFFVGDNDAVAERAKRICSRCEVRLDCLALALSSPRLDGVWGGLTARERARFMRQREHPPTAGT